MPTITLQDITVRFGDHSEKSLLSAATQIAARAFDRGKRLAEAEAYRLHHEPPDRPNALDQVSLVVHDGETMVLLGPSGCGKTTLLRVMAGLIDPQDGYVFFDDIELKAIPSKDRGIGMVFQSYALFPHMTSYDNIGFFDTIRKHPERIPERIEHVAKVMGVDIKHLLSRKPPTLSGGEQQRVAVARCLARDPKLFLFDEPLANLDAKLRTETRVQIKRLLRHYKITSVYVTHDQVEAISLADRIAVMRGGKIEQVGTYHQIYDRPVNAFVAEFFGNPPMNLFEGFMRDNFWEGEGFQVGPFHTFPSGSGQIWLGIRPEYVEVADSGFEAQVELIEPIFTENVQLIYVRIGRHGCIARVSLERLFQVGTTVHVRFPLEKIYLFDNY